MQHIENSSRCASSVHNRTTSCPRIQSPSNEHWSAVSLCLAFSRSRQATHAFFRQTCPREVLRQAPFGKHQEALNARGKRNFQAASDCWNEKIPYFPHAANSHKAHRYRSAWRFCLILVNNGEAPTATKPQKRDAYQKAVR